MDQANVSNVAYGTKDPTFSLPITASTVMIFNDSLKHDVTYSLNGRDDDGTVGDDDTAGE